jgi:aminoglycoside phosphotransferase (APT) family kinase protein
VIDFGCAGVGDPSCDLVIACTFLDEASRKIFRSTIGLDPETWQRARGWAIWKALITLVRRGDNDPSEAKGAAQIIRDVLDDHFRSARQRE